MSYFSKTQQNVVADANNSSSTNLDGGNSYTFTGTYTSTLGVAGIQVSLKANKNCTVKVQQSPDHSNWDIEDSYTYYYSKGGQSWTVQAVNSYVRVIVTTNSETTTTFRLQTALCPVVEALPRSVDDYNRLKVSSVQYDPSFNKYAITSPMRSLKTSTSVRLVGTTFTGGTLDAQFWTASLGTGGSATPAGGECPIKTGTGAANNATSIVSVRAARYVGASPNYYRGVIVLPAWTTNAEGKAVTAQWGAWDCANDGYYFEATQTNPATTPTLALRSMKGTTAAAAITTFNGDYGSSYTLDNNVHTYEIYWTNSSVWYFIDDVLLHKTTASTATLTNTTTLKIGIKIANSGDNQSDNTITVRASTINRLGQLTTSPQYYHIAGAGTAYCKLGAGTLHTVTVNQAGTLCTIYDNTTNSAPIIAIIDTAKATGVSGSVQYGCPFFTGLTVVTTGAGTDITVVYE